jgi:hypothetical protein
MQRVDVHVRALGRTWCRTCCPVLHSVPACVADNLENVALACRLAVLAAPVLLSVATVKSPQCSPDHLAGVSARQQRSQQVAPYWPQGANNENLSSTA